MKRARSRLGSRPVNGVLIGWLAATLSPHVAAKVYCPITLLAPFPLLPAFWRRRRQDAPARPPSILFLFIAII